MHSRSCVADSTIKISRRRWNEIQGGAEYATSAWSCYEGKRQAVTWHFSDGEVSVEGEDGMQCVVDLPISQLIAQIAVRCAP